MASNGLLYNWRPITLKPLAPDLAKKLPFAQKFTLDDTVYIHEDDVQYIIQSNNLTDDEQNALTDATKEKALILTGIKASSGVLRSQAASKKLIESTVKLATNSAASKLSEYYSSAARAELQSYREQLDSERTTRLRSMFAALDLNSQNEMNRPNLGGYVLLRSAVAAAPDVSVGDEQFEVVHLTTKDGSRKRQKITGGSAFQAEQLEEYKVITGQFENADPSKMQMLSADLPFSLYPVPRTSQIDTSNPNVRAGLVNLKLQLSLTNQKNLGSLDTPEYEFSAHFCDLDHHMNEAKNVARIAACAIFGSQKCESAYDLGNRLVNVHLGQELPNPKDLLRYVNSDHLQPFKESCSPCGWLLWPKLQENHAGASIDIEKYLFDLDPFRVLNEDENKQVSDFLTGFEEEISRHFNVDKGGKYIVLTGTDKEVPRHYNLNRVITLTESPGKWCLGRSASSFGTAVMAAAALLQKELDAVEETPDTLVGNRLLEQDDVIENPTQFSDYFEPTEGVSSGPFTRVDPATVTDNNTIVFKKYSRHGKVSEGQGFTETDKKWRIADIQRIDKFVERSNDSTDPDEENWFQRPRQSAWTHNQRLKQSCVIKGRVVKIYGQLRAQGDNWKKFKFASLAKSTQHTDERSAFESAEKCVPIRDIAMYDSNLYLGTVADTETHPCYSTIKKISPEDLGRRLAQSFLGWHYSSTNALGRTTHAIVSVGHNSKLDTKSEDATSTDEDNDDSEDANSTVEVSLDGAVLTPASGYENVLNYLQSFTSENDPSQENIYDYYKDLQTLLAQFNRSQPNLIETAEVVVKGPSDDAVATVCIVNGFIRPTATYHIIVKEICGHLDDLLAAAGDGRDWIHMSRSGTRYFWQKYKEAKATQVANSFVFYSLMYSAFQDPTIAKTECLQIIRLAYTQALVRADGGTHQKHLLGANEAMHALLTCCRRLLLKPISNKK